MTTRAKEPPGAGSRTGAGIVLAAGLLVLLIAAAVGSERTDLGEGRSPLVAQILGGVIVGGFGALAVLGAWLLMFRRGMVRFPRRPGGPVVPWWVRSIVTIGILVLVIVIALLVLGDRPPPEEPPPTSSASTEADPADRGAPTSAESEGPSAAFYAGVALAIAVVLVVAARAGRGPAEDADDDADEDELPELDPVQAVAEASLEALSAEADPRRAVIAAYARVQTLLAGEGLPRAPSETEPEYLTRVLRHYGATAAPARRLTELFEAARYGSAPVDERMRAEAIEAASALRDGAMARTGAG